MKDIDAAKADFTYKLNEKFIKERKLLKSNAEKSKIDKQMEIETKKRVR